MTGFADPMRERDTEGLWPVLPSALENQTWDVAKTSFAVLFAFARIGSMVSRLLIGQDVGVKVTVR